MHQWSYQVAFLCQGCHHFTEEWLTGPVLKLRNNGSGRCPNSIRCHGTLADGDYSIRVRDQTPFHILYSASLTTATPHPCPSQQQNRSRNYSDRSIQTCVTRNHSASFVLGTFISATSGQLNASHVTCGELKKRSFTTSNFGTP